MDNKVDIAQLKANTDMVELIGRYVSLKRDGEHWVGMCPFHDDHHASFKVTPTKKICYCFACKAGGDVFDFVERYFNKTKSEAINFIKDPNNNAGALPVHFENRPTQKKEVEKDEWKQIIPATPKEGMYIHYKHGKPSKTWPYVTPEGGLICVVCRFDFENGEKEVLPLIYAQKGAVTKWIFKGTEKPRPLKNLDKIHAKPLALILIVEGEKTCDAAERLYPNTIVTCWIGGVAGVKHTDWSPLKDRNVIYWPDNDQPGFDAMHCVHGHLEEIVESAKWVLMPPGVEKGWDLADADWTHEYAKEYSSTNIIDYPGIGFKWGEGNNKVNEMSWDIGVMERSEKKTPKELKAEAKQAKEDEKKEKEKERSAGYNLPPVDNDGDPEEMPLMGTEFFRILGVQKEGNGMIYYFYAFATKTVIGLSPSSMTKNNLMQLAPLNWWKNTFVDQKNGFSVDRAANYLINKSSTAGTFSDRWIRGRGAWVDNKNIVIHAGDKLFVNGVETRLADYESKYIYELGDELGFSVDNPATAKSSSRLLELLKLLKWERSVNAWLLAGFCVVAPVCGALNWRPHIWLTGPAGSGKTWVFKNILRALLGETGLAVQGETSEAGLRQTLKHDALPIIFDEAEGEDRKAQDRMQSVLALMRASSANDSGVMAKGSAGGSAKTYMIRSCFAFASIGVQVAQQSDRTRVTILGLLKANGPDTDQKWKEFQKQYAELMTEQFCDSIRARTVSLLPTILKNVKTFSAAAASVLGEQRAGDQVGVLLAGAYSLVKNTAITFEEAVKWVSDKQWDEEKGLGSTRDEVALLNHLLEQVLGVETNHATVKRSVGELVRICMYLRYEESEITVAQANEHLQRVGMKVTSDHLIISNTDINIRRMLKETAWSQNHNKILKRLEGAVMLESERFASGVKTRAIGLHKSIVYPGLQPESVTNPQPVAPDPVVEISKPVIDNYTQQDLEF